MAKIQIVILCFSSFLILASCQTGLLEGKTCEKSFQCWRTEPIDETGIPLVLVPRMRVAKRLEIPILGRSSTGQCSSEFLQYSNCLNLSTRVSLKFLQYPIPTKFVRCLISIRTFNIFNYCFPRIILSKKSKISSKGNIRLI